MNFQNIADHFRSSTEPVRVSKIVVISDQGDYTGDGKMWREGYHIELEVTLHGDSELPMVGGVYTREKFWKIGGVIEEQVPFWGVSLPGQHGLQTARFTVRSGRFDFDRIHHLVLPFEDGSLRDAVLEAVETGEPPNGTVAGDCAFARITDYKLIWADEFTVTVSENPYLGKTTNQRRDTLRGEFDTFEYGLIKRDLDTDVHVRVKNDAIGPHVELTRMMQAMYRSLAFLHGRHCWPQWERFEEGRNVVAEYTTAPRPVSINNHTLLTSTTASNGARPTELIGKLLQCFLRGDDFAEGFDNYLFLAREAAGSDTPAHIRALGLCTVFEGFVGFLHDQLCVAGHGVRDVEFEEAKADLVQFAKGQMAQSAGSSAQTVAWNRCIGLLSSARPLRPADKYQQLIQTLSLPADKMQLALAAWKKYRHPLAHGVSPRGGLMEQMFATSRIAGAINILAGAAVGYSGLAVLSRIEDEYIRIPSRNPDSF